MGKITIALTMTIEQCRNFVLQFGQSTNFTPNIKRF